MGKWSNYQDLMPDAEDLANDWQRVAAGPEGTSDLILPFQFAPDRQPTEPQFVLADGMVTEMRDVLKDGGAVPFNGILHSYRKCQCPGKVHRPGCNLGRSVQHAVTKLIREMECRTRMKLAVMPIEEGKFTITIDDKDGLAPPEVRFTITPMEIVYQEPEWAPEIHEDVPSVN